MCLVKKGGGFPDQSMFLITVRYVLLFDCLFGKLLSFFFSKEAKKHSRAGLCLANHGKYHLLAGSGWNALYQLSVLHPCLGFQTFQQLLSGCDVLCSAESLPTMKSTCIHLSGQIIVTSHDLAKKCGGLIREIPVFQGNLDW